MATVRAAANVSSAGPGPGSRLRQPAEARGSLGAAERLLGPFAGVDTDGRERSEPRAALDPAIASVVLDGVRIPVALVVAVATPDGRRLESYDAGGRLLCTVVQVNGGHPRQRPAHPLRR